MIRKTTVVLLILIGWVRVLHADKSDDELVFWQSKNEVVKVSVDCEEVFLNVFRLIRLRDRKLVVPKLRYLQGHKTAFGYRKVQKAGGFTHTITKTKPWIYLPKRSDITEHIFLCRVVNNPEVKTMVPDWSDWVVWKVDASTAKDGSLISIPGYEKLKMVNQANEMGELIKECLPIYHEAKRLNDQALAKPVSATEPRPWWTW